MVARMRTYAMQGITVMPVDVQVQMAPGMVAFNVVGLPDNAVRESRERVRAALHAMGLSLPPKRITVNLAPAGVLKEGSHYDLPIALALLQAMEILKVDCGLDRYAALGELALDGALLPVKAVLPAAVQANAEDLGLFCPTGNAAEAAWSGADCYAAPSLIAILNHFNNGLPLPRVQPGQAPEPERLPDMRDVRGQETARRVLEIAAAGGHNLLLCGPPGAGKSLLAARLPSLLPPLTPAEALEVSILHSVAGTVGAAGLVSRRPYRDPHHSASLPALVGGGSKALPGEVSLAHRGVLFLDELPEFNRAVLEALRQPLESGSVTVARATSHVTYPARVQLVAAMNPCRCGHFGDPIRACRRQPHCATDYQGRLSGPFLDRIDLHLDVAAVEPAALLRQPAGEDSAPIAARVAEARDRATARLRAAGFDGAATCNAELTGEAFDACIRASDAARELLGHAAQRLHLSGRALHRMLKVARSIADLAGAKTLERVHMAEALSYRRSLVPA